ncbi:MAG: MBL fold metallo-hydrolase [Rhodospirillales bacterium]|jgi:glyoxylase-like metal-dependent hydrolase (beta-lactamase superfamily II)|nr:MBL fold metallo-hydrolase [Rhodospirillales bacterium]
MNHHHTKQKPVAEVWYSIEACPDNIIRLRESHIDSYAVGDIWLVRGNESDLVIDTGCGIISPIPVIESITQRPVTAVALNCYYDHSGGWHNFSMRACHPLDAPYLANPDAEQAGVSDYLNNETMYSLPWEGYRVEDYKMTQAEPTRLVEDGDIFDLGNRTLEVLHIPGRSSGGLAIWEAATGSLFTSDMLYDGNHGLAWPPGDPKVYCASLQRMRDLPVKCVYAGHYGPVGRERMLEVIDKQLADLA